MAEISITNYSKLKEYFGRFDAEFYRPDSLSADQLIKSSNYSFLGHLVNEGYRVVYENTKILSPDKINLEKDSRFIQATNISSDGLWIEVDEIGFVHEKDWIKYPKGRLEIGEILIEVKGQAQKVTIVQDYVPIRTLVTGSLFKLSLKPKTISHEFLFAFFNCRYGRILRDRTKVNTLISYVSKPELYKIPIPIPDDISVRKISSLVKKSFEKQILSQYNLNQAKHLLEKDLGLDKIHFINQKSYSTSVMEIITDRRMNAEYFSPQIKEILSQPFLKNSKKLGEIFHIVRGLSPSQYYTSGIPVIKTKNIRVPEIDEDKISDFIQTKSNFVFIKENDLLLASMGVGSLGRISFISNLKKEFIIDGTLRILRRRSNTAINFVVPTMLFLTSKIGQKLIYRGIVGSTGIISLPDNYLMKIPIPSFSSDLCNEITDLVMQSIHAKKESKFLLDQAKTAVETLIENAAIHIS